MNDFWDNRYSSEEFVYGTEPNEFFKTEIDRLLPRKLLALAEGEGRNGVYAASLGWDVTAVDFSSVAREKALRLASEKNTTIHYIVNNLESFQPRANTYNAVSMIFMHLDPLLSDLVHSRAVDSLKPGGRIILEVYAKEQLGKNSGGPQNIDMLYSVSEIRRNFSELKIITLEKEVIYLNESKYHSGEAAVIKSSMRKVLFITYFWPPSGKATLHWPMSIIKYLPASGWQPEVLTVENESFTQKDESLLKGIDPDLIVYKSKAFEPFNIYRRFTGKEKDEQLIASETISIENKSLSHQLSIWIRMNIFVPDARIGWYLSAVKKGKEILSSKHFDAIVTIGPPHSTHLIGMKLSKSYQVPHIPVLIDPWVDIIYYKNFKRSRPTLTLDNYLEKSVMQNAASVIFVTKSTLEDYQEKYSFINGKSHVLYWGYNESDFEGLQPASKEKDYKLILHAGNIFDYQNPVKLWQRIKEENKRVDTRIKFIGTVSPAIKTQIQINDLSGKTDFGGFLPYKEMLTELINADYLLVCATEKRHLPGKLFEYMRAGKPVLAFGDDNEEVKEILTRANSGMIFRYNEDPVEFFKNADIFRTDADVVREFDRKRIALRLGEILSQ
jgi:glycosyltransferase involved in cell wall biosynthesis